MSQTENLLGNRDRDEPIMNQTLNPDLEQPHNAGSTSPSTSANNNKQQDLLKKDATGSKKKYSLYENENENEDMLSNVDSCDVNDHCYIPPVLDVHFWKTNLKDQKAFSVCRMFTRAYAPCFEGGFRGPNPNRKDSWKSLFTMISLYIALAEIAVYIAICIKAEKVAFWQIVPDDQTLLKFGGLNKDTLKSHLEYYRLLSFIFLNSSIFQLVVNVFSLFYFAMIFEKVWGKIRFIIVFVLGGAIGGLFNAMQNENTCAGASCAIMSVMGTFTLLLFMLWPKIGSVSKREFAFWMMMVPFEFVATSFLPKVDWIAHIASFVAGLAIGAFLFFKNLQTKKAGISLLSIGIIATIACIVIPVVILYLV